MATKLPLGIFTRGRRDMRISDLAQGGIYSTGGAQTIELCLGNNTTRGAYLAVYGICAWRAANPQTMLAWVLAGTQGGTNGDIRMLEPGSGMVEGTITAVNSAGANLPANGMPFIADGKTWLTWGDLPMFIIPPGQQLVVVPAQYLGTVPAFEPVFASFLWGLYGTPKRPVLS